MIAHTWRQEAEPRLDSIQNVAIVFSYGTNDCWLENGSPQVTFERQMNNTRLILREAAARWPTLMIGPPGLPTYEQNALRETDHRERCDAMQKVCAENAVPYFDTLSVFPTFRNWSGEAIGYDGAHPGAGGYSEMAEAIGAWPAWHALLERLKA